MTISITDIKYIVTADIDLDYMAQLLVVESSMARGYHRASSAELRKFLGMYGFYDQYYVSGSPHITLSREGRAYPGHELELGLPRTYSINLTRIRPLLLKCEHAIRHLCWEENDVPKHCMICVKCVKIRKGSDIKRFDSESLLTKLKRIINERP